MRINSNQWSLAVAATMAALLASYVPVAAMPDTSVRSLTEDPTVSQVSSVSELTDVDPNQWAFQALKSLVERYGCIEGYPSRKFLGNQALTRYEFAAGLNACLDKVNELIAAGTLDLVSKDDLAALQRLQDEQKALANGLASDIDALEAKTRELEANLFSRTAKLDGEEIMTVAGAGAPGNIQTTNAAPTSANLIPGDSQNVIFGTRTRLNIRSRNIAVRGDQLRIRFTAFTGDGQFYGSSGFSRVGRYDTLQPGAPINGNAVPTFDKVYYEVPLGRDLRFTIGPRVENVDILGTNLNTASEARNFSMRVFRRSLPISLTNTSLPGAAIVWNLGSAFVLRGYYGASAGGRSFGNGSGGVTGPGQVAGEFGFKPDSRFDLGVGFYHTTCDAVNTATGDVGEAPSTQNRIFCDASVGGSTRYPFTGTPGTFSNVVHDTWNAHLDWDLFPSVSVFGRYSFGTATLNDGISSADTVSASINYSEWMAGLTFKDIFGQVGNAIGIGVVQPGNIYSNTAFSAVTTTAPTVAFGSTTFPAGTTIPNATEYDYGIYYRIALGPRVTLTPEFYLITNPGSISANPTVSIGSLKAVFNF